MSHKRPPVPLIILVILIILGTAGYLIWTNLPARAAAGPTALTASGTVETTEVSISPELSGKVIEILVDEGDVVKQGDVILRLDSTLLDAQRAVASAALDTARSAAATADAAVVSAQVQYDLALRSALVDDKAQRAADWKDANPTDFDQPAWYFTHDEKLAAARAKVVEAETSLKDKQEYLQFVEDKNTSQTFIAAEKDLVEARAAYIVAKKLLDSTTTDLRDAAQIIFDDAKAILDDAQTAYTDAITTEGVADLLTARADLRIAMERCDLAQDEVRSMETGALSPKLAAFQAAVDQAQASATQAHTAVKQAEANLALLDAQISRLVVFSPSAGTVLTRSIQPGEVVSPGARVLTLGRLDELTITVYVPETRIGEVSLGQSADVTVDSFSGETFSATVIHISDRAEFTPRNVQTVDGRKNTVFAVKLRLDNLDAKLKPGMPADVVFK
jgi:HlyD family secretion protein